MSYQPHFIANYEENGGLDKYFEPFLLPEKAFPKLEDAYAWRGRIKRRLGFEYLGRLRRRIVQVGEGVTSGANPFAIADLLVSVRATEANAEIQPSTVSIVISRGNADETTYTDDGLGNLVMTAGGTYAIITASINYITGGIVFQFDPLTVPAAGLAIDSTFFYYPGLPVMGLPDDITDVINEENLRAFDTKYAYRFNAGQFEELPSVAPVTWSGTDSDFFWTQTYWPMTPGTTKLMWTTNFSLAAGTRNPTRYYNSTTTTWTDFTPLITAADTLYSARCVVPYKNRLLMFNTLEGTTAGTIAAATNYPQRLRYSRIGDPTLVDSYRSDQPGKGGFVDVPSDQEIISVEFIKDVLIVKLERSSWKIIYTGNETLPFYFEKINTELGAESTFSLVPFDRGVFSIGNVGILTDDSVNVARIDQRIPDTVFEINNADNGPKRVHGIRNFTEQLVYWSYPDFQKTDPATSKSLKFPSKVLVYNYLNNSYAIFNDSFTCYGYYQRNSSKTWSAYPITTWNNAAFTWNSGINQARYPDIVGGNQQGFVVVLNQQTFNGISFAIQAIAAQAITNLCLITSVDHNLQTGQFVKLTSILGSGLPDPSLLNDQIYKVVVIDKDTYSLRLFNALLNDFEDVLFPGGTYIGAGRVVVLNNINITTKVFAPFYEDNGQVRVGYIDFLLDKTTEGQMTCNVYVDEQDVTSISDPNVTMSGGVATSGVLGTNTVLTSPENVTIIPYQAKQKKIWHRMFIQSIAQNFQLQLYLNDLQMIDETISSSDIVLHAMTIYISKNARLTQ